MSYRAQLRTFSSFPFPPPGTITPTENHFNQFTFNFIYIFTQITSGFDDNIAGPFAECGLHRQMANAHIRQFFAIIKSLMPFRCAINEIVQYDNVARFNVLLQRSGGRRYHHMCATDIFQCPNISAIIHIRWHYGMFATMPCQQYTIDTIYSSLDEHVRWSAWKSQISICVNHIIQKLPCLMCDVARNYIINDMLLALP